CRGPCGPTEAESRREHARTAGRGKPGRRVALISAISRNCSFGAEQGGYHRRRLPHLPVMAALQVPGHCRWLNPEFFGNVLLVLELKRRTDGFPLALRHLLYQGIVQPVNQVEQGVAFTVPGHELAQAPVLVPFRGL